MNQSGDPEILPSFLISSSAGELVRLYVDITTSRSLLLSMCSGANLMWTVRDL
jgi:hypothetical protein